MKTVLYLLCRCFFCLAERYLKMRKGYNKRFTDEEIKVLKENPYVKDVRYDRLTVTYEFKLILYDAWLKNPGTSSIRATLSAYGFNTRIIGATWIGHQNSKFKINGKPLRGKNKILGEYEYLNNPTKEDNDYLLSTGKFVKKRNGLHFSDDFIKEIIIDYPSATIEEKLEKYNINPVKVGYYRIHNLRRRLDNHQAFNKCSINSDEVIEKYHNHPYVSKCNRKTFGLSHHFYNEALQFIELSFKEILDIFEIDYHDLNINTLYRMQSKLKQWSFLEVEEINSENDIILQIQKNKEKAYLKMIYSNFEFIKCHLSSFTYQDKKKLCMWIKEMPHDRYDFSIRKVLSMIGLSKSQYYHILSHDDYGYRENRDNRDVEVIKQVLASEPYPMGHRMVYMKMKKITGIQFGKNKILRLMRKYGLLSTVRLKKDSRIQAKKQLEERKKDNLLKRQFRLAKPKEILLTDVTYMKIGAGQTVYMSAIKDSVSGRAYALNVSETNDLLLAESSVNELGEFNHPIFHSDQGALYLAPYYQDKIGKLGFRQSMSKRGNCWDNAPQESFFGHFKDECRELIRQCQTIEELSKVVQDYKVYYNERRPQWTRHQMTPLEYESYILSMNDEEYEKYIRLEKKKYDMMMSKAKEKAKKRAQDIGAFGG